MDSFYCFYIAWGRELLGGRLKMATYRIEMNNINKSFGGVRALKGVTFKVKPGEIMALVGENGAGKSTLMKILSGAYTKDEGEILIDGRPVEINSPQKGRSIGINIIYQELTIVPDLTVAENIFLGNLPVRNGIIQWSKLNQKAEELIQSIGFSLNPKTIAGNLSVAHQQIVEICKALSHDARVLILDEPTAVLAPREVKTLFEILKNLKEKGVSIIYISHRLEEVLEIADQITVLKDGEVTGTGTPKEMGKDNIINLMIGRRITDMYPQRDIPTGKEIFRVENLNNDKVENVSFVVKAGEVFGIAGLVGSGRTEIAKAIFGVDPVQTGIIYLDNKQLKNKSPKEAASRGIGMVPENRKEEGVILDMTVRENITITNLKNVSQLGFIKSKEESDFCQQLVEKLRVKTATIDAPVNSLSGGNQQKVSLAKWFGITLKLIILDEPTRGIDVGAKVEIYKLINELARQGLGVIMISSEMMEIIGMCDRAAVMHRGKMIGILEKDELTEENIMRLATGEEKNNEKK